jgi:hypothetical protein
MPAVLHVAIAEGVVAVDRLEGLSTELQNLSQQRLSMLDGIFRADIVFNVTHHDGDKFATFSQELYRYHLTLRGHTRACDFHNVLLVASKTSSRKDSSGPRPQTKYEEGRHGVDPPGRPPFELTEC